MGKAPLLLVGAAVSKIGWLAFVVMLSRTIGATGFGAFAVVQTIVLVTVDLATPLNVNVAVRHGAVRERDGDLSRLLGLLVTTLLVVAVPFAAVLALCGPWIGATAFDSSEVGESLRWLAPCLPALAAHRLSSQLLVVDRRVQLRVIVVDLLPLPLLGVVAVVAQDAPDAALGYGLAMSVSAAMSWVLLIRRHGISFSGVRGELREIRRFATDVYMMANANNATRLGDMVLVGIVLDVRAAGIYAAATNLGLGTDLVTKSFSTAIGPSTAVALHEGRTADARRIYRRTTSTAAALVAVGCVALWTGGDAFLGLLFGSEFAVGWGVLVLLTAAGAIRAATTGSSTILTNGGMQRRELYHALVGGLLTFVLVPSLGAIFGLGGIALATLLATAAVQGLREKLLNTLFAAEFSLRDNRFAIISAAALLAAVAVALRFALGITTGEREISVVIGSSLLALGIFGPVTARRAKAEFSAVAGLRS